MGTLCPTNPYSDIGTMPTQAPVCSPRDHFCRVHSCITHSCRATGSCLIWNPKAFPLCPTWHFSPLQVDFLSFSFITLTNTWVFHSSVKGLMFISASDNLPLRNPLPETPFPWVLTFSSQISCYLLREIFLIIPYKVLPSKFVIYQCFNAFIALISGISQGLLLLLLLLCVVCLKEGNVVI